MSLLMFCKIEKGDSQENAGFIVRCNIDAARMTTEQKATKNMASLDIFNISNINAGADIFFFVTFRY